MSIRLICDCGKQFRVSDEMDGKRVKCPECGAAVSVSAAQATDTPVQRSSERRTPKRKRKGQAENDSLAWLKSPLVLAGGGALFVLLVVIIWLGLGTEGGNQGNKAGPTPEPAAANLGPEAALETAKSLRSSDFTARQRAAEQLKTLWPQLAPQSKEAVLAFLTGEMNDTGHPGHLNIVRFLHHGVPEAPLALPVLQKRLAGKSRDSIAIIEAFYHHAQQTDVPLDGNIALFSAASAHLEGYSSELRVTLEAQTWAKERIKAAGKEAAGPLTAALERQQRGAAHLLTLLGDMGADAAAATPVLLRMLQAEKDPVKYGPIVRALGGIGPPAAIALPELLARLGTFRADASVQENISKLGSAQALDVRVIDTVLKSQEDRNSIFFRQDASLVAWALRGLEGREAEASVLAARLVALKRSVDQQLAASSSPAVGKRVTVFRNGQLDEEATRRANEDQAKQALVWEATRQRFRAELAECDRRLNVILKKVSG